jgi:hypothetical protein
MNILMVFRSIFRVIIKRKFFIFLILFFIIIIYSSLLMLSYWARDFLSWERDMATQKWIGDAYISFFNTKKRSPTSLKELVAEGFLPIYSTRYIEPPGFFVKDYSFEESNYVIYPIESTFERYGVKIYIARRDESGELHLLAPANAYIRDQLKNLGQGQRKPPTSQP